ncbi:hypothetical protein V6R86_09315 [Sphingomonas kaistensis]|uniref:Spore coat protein U domain-containing protein n=1 Tax=Sphingomonas kaistensis TaxID=298708 RepID=A0ABZ2G440_9SPHN
MRLMTQMTAALLGSALLSTTAGAAPTQGTLGATSTGSIQINASVPTRVRISGLTDVTLANLDPTANAVAAQNVCVWSNSSTRGYRITATGSGTGNAFTLANGALSAVPYAVEWGGSTGLSSGTALSAGAPLPGQVSTATRADCSAGPASSASLIVRLAAADLQQMSAATNYTGTLTLLVAPE